MTHNTQDWKEEFRKKCVYSLRMDGNQTLQLTDFISNLLTSQLNSLIEKLENSKKGIQNTSGNILSDSFYNCVISDAQTIIKGKMEKK